MKYFKDSNGNIYGIEDDQDHLIKPTWTEFTAAEFDAFKNPTKTTEQLVEENNNTIYAELDELDKVSIRDIREWISKHPDAPQMLKDREAQAIDARNRLQ